MERFGGETRYLRMEDVFNLHHVGTPFIKRNYKDIIREMEADGLIAAVPPAEKRRKRKGQRTFGDDVEVKFLPPKGS